MKKNFTLLLILAFLFSGLLPAYGAPQISAGVFKKTGQAKSGAKLQSAADETVGLVFFPENGKAKNIDTSFLDSRSITYIKSEKLLSAKVPVRHIESLTQIKGVESIELDMKIKALETVSEGRDSVNASVYTYNNVGGAGVKIAVIDVGFKSYPYLRSIGELPSSLITKDFTLPGAPAVNDFYETEKHGSACAEIVYDIAPQAQMYLLKVDTQTSLENAFDYCKAQGIRIASCSIGFIAGFWCDGSGRYAQSATDAYNNGILPVFAAGNEALMSWFGKFSGNADNWMVFPGGKDYLEVYVYPLGDIHMMWDDFAARDKKYTLYMYDSTGSSLLDSSVWNPGNTPSVFVSNLSYYSVRVRLKIKKENDGPDLGIRLSFDSGAYINSSDRRSDSSLSSPGDSREALTVGAVDAKNWANGPVESYSSRGPTLQSASLPQAQKPDITGPTYVSTVMYGPRGFNGTSGATPHISAAAALLLSLDRTMSAAQLKDKVLSYSRAIATSPDNIYGSGKLVLGTELIPDASAGDIVCFPNPASISKNGHVKITNLPYNTSLIDINVYTVTGEFVKSFSSSDLKSMNGRMTIEWNLKNQGGAQVAPGVYFFTVNTPVSGKKVKKIAIQK
jgi:subtilisin family serine protease